MPMGLKFCTCKACRCGKKRTSNRVRIQRVRRSLKLLNRDAVRKGKETIPALSVVYTD